IRLVERQPLAFWQRDGKLVLVDRDGVVVPSDHLDRFGNLIVLVGADAPQAGGALIDMLASEPELAAHVAAAVRVGGRRWTLHLDDGVDVALPEEGADAAWHRLAALERSDGILERRRGGEPEIVGIGHQVSRGVKNGVIVDIDAASQSVLAAAHAAEQMSGETLSEVVVNLSGGFNPSRLVKSEITLNGREITDSDMRRVLDHGHALKEPSDRTVVHSIPVGFSVDQSRGIRDPRGMYGQKLGVNMHLVTAQSGAVRNLATCIGRCHLEIAALVVSPYAAGLAALVEDETELG